MPNARSDPLSQVVSERGRSAGPAGQHASETGSGDRGTGDVWSFRGPMILDQCEAKAKSTTSVDGPVASG